MKKYGADLSKSHSIEHHFNVYSKENGLQFIKWAKTNGFEVTPLEKGEWKKKTYYYFDIIKPALPNLDSLTPDTSLMLRMAEEYECDYDGWGCLIEE